MRIAPTISEFTRLAEDRRVISVHAKLLADDLTPVVDALVRGLLEQRAEARAAKDFATADAIRDRIKAAGVEIEDTPTGPNWSVQR